MSGESSGPPTQPGIDNAAARALIVGAMVGVGVFLAPGRMARAVPNGGVQLALWLLGALGALGGTLAYAAWARRMPRSGGDAVFQKAAWGPGPGALTGALLFFGAFCGSNATLAAALGEYQAPAALGLAEGWPARGLHIGPLGPNKLVALFVIGVLSVIQAHGMRVSLGLQRALSAAPVVAFALLSVGVLGAAALGLLPLPPPAPPAPVAAQGLLSGWLAAHFAFAGWTSAAYVAGELRDPGAGLRRASVQGVMLVSGLYFAIVGALLVGLGVPELAAAGEAGSALAQKLGGPLAARAMATLIGVGLLGTIHATLFGGARVAVALAEGGLLPRGLIPTEGAPPRRALGLQAAVIAALLLSGSADGLLDAVALIMIWIGTMTVTGLYRSLLRGAPPAAWPARLAEALGPLDLALISLHLLLGLVALGVELHGALLGEAGAAPLLWAGGFTALWLLAQRRRPSPG